MQTYKICSIAAICCGNIHHQTFNGKGYPRLKSNGTIQAPLGRDYADYQNHAPLSGTEIPTEALIVGLADRYDALRSRRPYKEAYSYEKTLAALRNHPPLFLCRCFDFFVGIVYKDSYKKATRLFT